MNIISLALRLSRLTPILCTFLSVLAFDSRARAEEPYVTWARSSAWGFDVGSGFALTSKGETFVSTSGGAFSDARLLKFDGQGRLASSNLLSKLPGSMTYISGLATDSAGAVFLAGLGGSGRNAFSVVKWGSSGELIWERRENAPLDASRANLAIAITADSPGNVWVSGISRGPLSLGSYSFGDGGGPVLCKLGPDGQVLFARRIEHQTTGSGTGAECFDLVVDRSGNILISGWLAAGIADFGGMTVYPGEGQPQPWGDNFIAKYDSNGTLMWVHLAGVTEARVGYLGMSIAPDHQGNVYFLESGLRLGKLDRNGAFLWEKEFSGAYLSMAHGVALDGSDQPVFTGEFSGSVRFDNAVLVSRAPSYGTDFFIAKADANGQILWAMRGGGGLYARGHGVLLDQSGNIFLSVDIGTQTVSFDGITLLPRPDDAGYGTVAVAKISERPPLRITNSIGSTTVIYPAKATNYVLEAAVSMQVASWSAVTNKTTVSGRDRRAQLPTSGSSRFFRLRKP